MSAINAIVEQACNEQVERDCYFFYGARTQADLYLVDELGESLDENLMLKEMPGVFCSSTSDSDTTRSMREGTRPEKL